MHFSTAIATVLSGASLVSAHFTVSYPWWRGDSGLNQWTFPCGGVNQSISANNRTRWPTAGGSIVFHPGHTWAQTYVNIAFGSNSTKFVPLVTPFNQTGKGTFCFKHIPIPDSIKGNVTDGAPATLQVIQLSAIGGALYNCMDITFASNASNPDDKVCFNDTTVGSANLDYPDVVPDVSQPTATCKAGAGSLKSSMGVMAAAVAMGVAVLIA